MEFSIIDFAALVAFGMLILSMAITFWRLVKGPTLPDRVVALDLFANLTIGMIFTLVFYTRQTIYLDVAVFIALIVFMGNVAVSRFLKRRFHDK
ncbi:MAG: pH regulation protein F [Bacteroidales bacterium]|nr:pH regulation protein F [Bacteroidales bacterium]